MMNRHLGIRYVYETIKTENTESSGHKDATHADLAAISADLLKNLEQAAINADMDQVNNVIDELRGINVDLADKLADLADDFEYGKIVRILQAYQMEIARTRHFSSEMMRKIDSKTLDKRMFTRLK